MTLLAAGIRAPEFELEGIDGQTFSLSHSAEEATVLVFFKNSCPTCRLTFPFLQRLYERVKGSPLRFWGVSQDSPEDTREFGRRHGTTFPLLPDKDGYPVSEAYGVTNVPSLLLVEPGGRITRSSMGFSRSELESLAVELQRRSGAGSVTPLFTASDDAPALKPG